MDPGAAKDRLLYVTSGSKVLAYAFPSGKLVGTIARLRHPAGLCTDTAGNLFVTEFAGQRISEFAHAGTKPIARLRDPGEEPVDCSFDPASGNLAVANRTSTLFSRGSLAVYAGERGAPKKYRVPAGGPAWFSVNSCGYDGSGNLFFDGLNYFGVTVDGELPAGASTTRAITVLETFGGPGKVQWDGTYVTLADRATGTIYQFTEHNALIYAGTVALGGSKRVDQSWIAGDSAIAPQVNGNDVPIYAYPAGGAPVMRIRGVRMPYGAAVSAPGKT